MIGPALTVIAYLLGSISFAEIVAKRAGIDIRAAGSGNPGATNVGRIVGKRQGRMVLVLDVLKGVIPAVLGVTLADDVWPAVIGFAATLGHCFPIWHRFRGGKGAATAAGVLVTLIPPAGITAALTYLVLRKTTRRASVGSLAGALVGGLVATALFLWRGLSPSELTMAWAIAALVLVRHHDNVVRLWNGTEPPS